MERTHLARSVICISHASPMLIPAIFGAWVLILWEALTRGFGVPFILLPPPSARIPITFVAVLIALGITGWVSARLGGADPVRATQRVIIGGALAMAVTYAIGRLVGGVV